MMMISLHLLSTPGEISSILCRLVRGPIAMIVTLLLVVSCSRRNCSDEVSEQSKWRVDCFFRVPVTVLIIIIKNY